MSRLKVLVVGASIAGPMTAYWLAKAGAAITVIERFPELRKGGQNIDIRTTGVSVMRKMPGLEEAVRANLFAIDGMCLVREDGTPFAVLKSTGNPDAQSLISEYEILRGDLNKILYDMTKYHPRIKYVFNEQVTSIQQTDIERNGSVMVEFMNGYPTSEYDLVVACDGATSRTRAIGLECGVRTHIHPVNAFSAFFTISDDLLNGSKVSEGWNALPGLGYSIDPDRTGNKAMLTSVHSACDELVPFREASSKGNDALKEYVIKRFQNTAWKVPQILKGLQASDDFYASEMVQVKLPALSKGRLVLVGDAGYCPGPTGVGTSGAMTGAYLLAGEICKHENDLQAGLQAYEKRMRPLITDWQKIPPGVPAAMAPRTLYGLWVRNAAFVVVSYLIPLGSLFSWVSGLFSSSMGSNTIELPEYEWTE